MGDLKLADLQSLFGTWFAELPDWAKLIVALFAAYLAARGFLDRVLSPLHEVLAQLAITINRLSVWLGEKLTRTTEQDEAEKAPVPVREIPVELTVWERRAPGEPSRPLSNSIPIITIANMKGGVAKTTIAANLAPYFRDTLGKKVLLIDFDYQGSLSQCVRGEAGYTDFDLTADVLLGTTSENPALFARAMRRQLEDIFIYPTHYPFATIENNLLAGWLQGTEANLMYRLCELLRRPDFQSAYGAVIIDCPPRLTPGSINALCASTHLLVPTTLDDMSTQATTYFLDQVSRMREAVFPVLRVMGVVPSIIYRETQLQDQERRALDRLKRYGSETWRRDDFVLQNAMLPRLADVARSAGIGVAYCRNQTAKDLFKRLGDELRTRF